MPKIKIHNDTKLLGKSAGLYDEQTETIHVLNKELLFKSILIHETVHWERRNLIVNKIHRLIRKNTLSKIGSIASVFITAYVALNLPKPFNLVGGLIMVVSLLLLGEIEEIKVRRETLRRLKAEEF